MNTAEKLTKITSSTFDIDAELAPLKYELNSHRIYQSLNSVEDVRIFMENHVFAVWDFMSIVKTLQSKLTTISVPWVPNKKPSIVRFINEIVYGEESDVNELGHPMSHFEMYLDAMTEINASKEQIDSFISSVHTKPNVLDSLKSIKINDKVKKFTEFTFEVIDTNKIHCIASAFTYGREDIIPDMFNEILNELDPDNLKYSKLKYYLDRHIEVDSGVHGPIARKMMKELCGANQKKWQEALHTAKECIIKRIQLWDAITDIIQVNTSKY